MSGRESDGKGDHGVESYSQVGSRRVICRGSLRDIVEEMSSLRTNITDFQVDDTRGLGLARHLGLEDAIVTYRHERLDRKFCAVLLIPSDEEHPPIDGQDDTPFTSPADPRLLVRYFKYYRLLMRNFASCYSFRAIDEILVYCLSNEENFEMSDSIMFPDDLLENTSLTDPLFNTRILRVRADNNKMKKEIALCLKNDWVTFPNVMARTLLGCSLPLYKVEDVRGEDALIYQSYMNSFKSEALDPKGGGFRREFVQGRHLSFATKHFRDEIEFGFRLSNDASGGRKDAEFRAFLSKARVRVEDDFKDMRRFELSEESLEILAKTLAKVVSSSTKDGLALIEKKDVFLWRNLKWLIEFVLIKVGDNFVFRSEFLNEWWVPERFTIFRLYLWREFLKRKIKHGTLSNLTIKIQGLDGNAIHIDRKIYFFIVFNEN